MAQNPTHTELAARIASTALLEGEFILRSGRPSKYYLDKYLFITRPDVLQPVAAMLAERIAAAESSLGRKVDRLAGAELGGVPLVTAASLKVDRPTVLVRNQKKSYGTGKQIEGELHDGDTVVLIEDVATSGGQAVEAVQTLTEAGAKVELVICIVDRQEGAREAVEGAGARFESLFTFADLGVES